MGKMFTHDLKKGLNSKISGLRFFGFWHPQPFSPFRLRLLYYINHVIAISFITLYIISVITDLVINRTSFHVIIEDGLFIVIVFMVVFKLYTFKSKSHRIENLSEIIYGPIDFFQRSSDKKIVNFIENTLYYDTLIDKWCKILIVVVDIALLSVLLINPEELPVRGAFPFNITNILWYSVAVFIQIGTATITLLLLYLMDLLLYSFIRWINSQYYILKYIYEKNTIEQFPLKHSNFEYHNDNDSIEYKLKICFKKFNLLNEVVGELNIIFNSTMFTQVITSCCMICMSCFQLAVGELETQYKIFFFLGAAMVQLFIICWFGSELIHVTNHVSDSIWLSKWTNNLNFNVKCLMLISLVAAKNPLEIKAGSFFVMSLETFVTVLRNAYSFFVLLTSYN